MDARYHKPENSKPEINWTDWPYRIGCPVWNSKRWVDLVYPRGVVQANVLGWYSHLFGTVEGNSTFYALPSMETMVGWARSTIPSFRFTFKFPRIISHDAMLRNCESELNRWLVLLNALQSENRLGPSFLQLGPRFSAKHWKELVSFLDLLPPNLPFAVEMRHRDWYDEGPWETQLHQTLRERNIDLVLFDSRALFSQPPEDESEAEAQSRKPQTPHRTSATASNPMVRLIGRNRVETVDEWWLPWAKQVAEWIQQGLTPWIFTHAPDDAFAPALARRFHIMVQHAWNTLNRENHNSQTVINDLPTLILPERVVQKSLFE